MTVKKPRELIRLEKRFSKWIGVRIAFDQILKLLRYDNGWDAKLIRVFYKTASKITEKVSLQHDKALKKYLAKAYPRDPNQGFVWYRLDEKLPVGKGDSNEPE